MRQEAFFRVKVLVVSFFHILEELSLRNAVPVFFPAPAVLKIPLFLFSQYLLFFSVVCFTGSCVSIFTGGFAEHEKRKNKDKRKIKALIKPPSVLLN